MSSGRCLDRLDENTITSNSILQRSDATLTEPCSETSLAGEPTIDSRNESAEESMPTASISLDELAQQTWAASSNKVSST